MPSSAVLLLLALVLGYLKRRRSSTGQQLPPGPPPVPLLGNVRGLDALYPWRSYTTWAAQYGDIIYTRLLSQDIIVISSEKVARDLLDRRSHNYSSRPASLMTMNELFGTEFSSIFLPYGDRWRLHRRFFHQALNVNAALTFRPIQMRMAHDLVKKLLMTPDDFSAHLQALSTSTIMSIMYDYRVKPKDDPVVVGVERAIDIAAREVRPEVAAFVATFPFLKYIPPWFPGAHFSSLALECRQSITKWVDAPFQHVKQNMEMGSAAPSMVSGILSRIHDGMHSEQEVAQLEKAVMEASASAYAAAAETTFSTLSIFVLAMILYPDVQAQAQAEIDSVIGENPTRLPDWEDRESLPYVDAVIKETLRWHPAVPLSIPHATVDDDIYEGYYIPKGSATVLINAWAMSRDPIKFPEPHTFRPERFLSSEKPSSTASSSVTAMDELSFAFGFGRRVCVGRHVADASLWISIVNMLSLFRFESVPGWDPGPNGENVKWAGGVTTYPQEFPCKITARHQVLNTERLAQLVESSSAY
ncbi:cytochrome P450 [Phlebopus sp. FC_14]|nr:cytochrome P450 [Phlebopus sp. FC_14]